MCRRQRSSTALIEKGILRVHAGHSRSGPAARRATRSDGWQSIRCVGGPGCTRLMRSSDATVLLLLR